MDFNREGFITMNKDRKKRILYFGANYEFFGPKDLSLNSGPEIIDNIEVHGLCGYPESEEFFLEYGPFNLVGVHLSADCAYYFAQFVRKKDRRVPLVLVTGLYRNESILFDLARIEFPHDKLINRWDNSKGWRGGANRLVKILEDLNKQTENA